MSVACSAIKQRQVAIVCDTENSFDAGCAPPARSRLLRLGGTGA